MQVLSRLMPWDISSAAYQAAVLANVREHYKSWDAEQLTRQNEIEALRWANPVQSKRGAVIETAWGLLLVADCGRSSHGVA